LTFIRNADVGTTQSRAVQL